MFKIVNNIILVKKEKNFGKKILIKKKKNDDYIFNVKCYTHTCQNDTISCGVYVCYFVEKLVKRQKELLSYRIFANE